MDVENGGADPHATHEKVHPALHRQITNWQIALAKLAALVEITMSRRSEPDARICALSVHIAQ
jgi:hypothetical protein